LKNAFWGIHLPGSPGVEFLSPERRKTYQALTIAEDAVVEWKRILRRYRLLTELSQLRSFFGIFAMIFAAKPCVSIAAL
jgi:hypothetical protein